MMDGESAAPSRTASLGRGRQRFTVTRLHHHGVDPHRVLLIGSRKLLATPAQEQVDALGQRVADRIWLSTERGVDVDLLWELRPVLTAIRYGLSSWRLWRYDAVVILVTGAASRPAPWRRTGIARLVHRVVSEMSTASAVLVVSLPTTHRTSPGRRRRSPNPDLPNVERFSISSDLRDGADAIAQQLIRALTADAASPRRATTSAPTRQTEHEQARQQAVDALQLHELQAEQRLQHVVRLAQETFESASAQISIIDRDRQWTLEASDRPRETAPRSFSLCNRTIQRAGATVIADTWQEPDLRGNPLIVGADPIRFYAAYPIESIHGHRIGALCIWDDVPHDVQDLDIAALRDLALLAEAEIITSDRTRRQ